MQSLGTLLRVKGGEIHSIEPHNTVYEAIAKMDKLNIGALIVLLDGKVNGIFTERDYLRKVMLNDRSSKTTEVGEVMTAELVMATVDQTVRQALAIMTDSRCRHLPVFDDGELVGVVSIGDLVKNVIKDQEAEIQLLHDYMYGR